MNQITSVDQYNHRRWNPRKLIRGVSLFSCCSLVVSGAYFLMKREAAVGPALTTHLNASAVGLSHLTLAAIGHVLSINLISFSCLFLTFFFFFDSSFWASAPIKSKIETFEALPLSPQVTPTENWPRTTSALRTLPVAVQGLAVQSGVWSLLGLVAHSSIAASLIRHPAHQLDHLALLHILVGLGFSASLCQELDPFLFDL